MTQAEIFRHFMGDVWNTGDNETYEKFRDANDVARTMGGVVTGDGCDDEWHSYLFPDGSIAEVQKNGHGTDIGPDEPGQYDPVDL